MRQKFLLSIGLGLAGVVLLFGPISWLLWKESVVAEEQRVGARARALGEQTEQLIVEAIAMLDRLNALQSPACSHEHLAAMHNAAFVQPHIKAIGFWQAAQRLCGAGFVQMEELRPLRADQIYDSGVIAWWPSEQTSIAGHPMFLIRFGEHHVAIDPQLLLDTGPIENLNAALWVEGLKLASRPATADLPDPSSLPVGLTVDGSGQRLISRFSLGTVFPIDIVASEPLGQFWQRYGPRLAIVGTLGLVLIVAWIVLVMRFWQRRFSLTGELRIAMADRSLNVEYQPIIDLANGKCVGAEALVRWPRKQGGLIPPDVFIPLAENAGLMPELTDAVLEITLRELGSTLRTNPELAINLNVSAQDLSDPGFESGMTSRLKAANVPFRSIKLEITERALINSEAARELIHTLRERGHPVAIDDFGTGYSSLSYLESFDLDILKIDKTFVDAIEMHAVTSNVIEHIIEMAKSLGLQTVAEGIETDHQSDWLQTQGVNLGQGYLFSKPLSASRFLTFLAHHETGFDAAGPSTNLPSPARA